MSGGFLVLLEGVVILIGVLLFFFFPDYRLKETKLTNKKTISNNS